MKRRRNGFSLSPQRGEGRGEGWEYQHADSTSDALGVTTPHPLIPLPVEGRGKPNLSRPGLLSFLALVALLFSFSASALEVSWTNNLLTVTGTNLPGGKLEVWYLEAFCRTGAHPRDWGKTT